MISKVLAAAAAGLCFTLGAAHAGPTVQDPQPQASSPAASPAEIPEGVGATQDVIVLELGPMQGGPANAEESAAMQMLLLQLLMMQSEMGGGEMQMMSPNAPTGTAI